MLKASLNDVLRAIAKQLSLEPQSLIKHAQEAPRAELRPDKLRPWPSGTGSESEKRILYAVAKSLQPMTIIDIGTRWGACTTQLLSAARNARCISIDIERTIHGGPQPVGKFIPKEYNYEQLFVDVTKWIAATKENANLIFEDTAHSQETTYKIYKHAERVLAPGGVIISHDACHPKFRGAVVAGIRQAGIEPEVYLVEGDSCGLAIWQKPKKKIEARWQNETATMENLHEQKVQTEDNAEAPKEKPKRKRRKKASEKIEERNCVDCGVDISRIKAEASIRTGRCILCYKALIDSNAPEHQEEIELFEKETERILSEAEKETSL